MDCDVVFFCNRMLVTLFSSSECPSARRMLSGHVTSVRGNVWVWSSTCRQREVKLNSEDNTRRLLGRNWSFSSFHPNGTLVNFVAMGTRRDVFVRKFHFSAWIRTFSLRSWGMYVLVWELKHLPTDSEFVDSGNSAEKGAFRSSFSPFISVADVLRRLDQEIKEGSFE